MRSLCTNPRRPDLGSGGELVQADEAMMQEEVANRGRRLAAIFGGFALCVGTVVVCLQDSGAGELSDIFQGHKRAHPHYEASYQ